MLVHPALTVAPSIRRVLVVGGGDGGTAREVLRYREVAQVILCEIDALVTEACKAHMTDLHVPWDEPRLMLLFRDGVAYLGEEGEPFDVILIDGSDPVGHAEGLFTAPFYESWRRSLVAACSRSERGALRCARTSCASSGPCEASSRASTRTSARRRSTRAAGLHLRFDHGRPIPHAGAAGADRAMLSLLQPGHPPRGVRPASDLRRALDDVS
jgi:hypothetical protein